MLPPLLFSSAFLVWLLVWHLQDRVSCSNKGLGLQSGQCPLWFKASACVLADQFQDVIVRPGKRSGCSAAQGASRRMKAATHVCRHKAPSPRLEQTTFLKRMDSR